MAELRARGQYSSLNFEIGVLGPIDARSLVPSSEYLTDEEWWNGAILYNGMPTVVFNGGNPIIYILRDKDNVTKASSWVQATGSSAYLEIKEYDTREDFPDKGQKDIIYVSRDDQRTYRWGGSVYSEISPTLVIGEIEGCAYDGGRGYELENDFRDLQSIVGKKSSESTDSIISKLNKLIIWHEG